MRREANEGCRYATHLKVKRLKGEKKQIQNIRQHFVTVKGKRV